MNNKKSPSDLLVQLLCQQSSPKDMARALKLLLTQKELEDIDNRLQIFRLLAQHEPQRAIASQLNVGIATVTRGAAAYRKHPAFIDHCLAQLMPDPASPRHRADGHPRPHSSDH